MKFSLNHIVKLVADKKAKLVVLARNVDPIELVVWLRTLCIKIPYVFVNRESKLEHLIHLENAATVALTEVRKEVLNLSCQSNNYY